MYNIGKLSNILQQMQGSRIGNYILTGLSSSLIENGKVRIFDSTRNPSNVIMPHSHRYDFACIVIKGEVINHTWSKGRENDNYTDEFELVELKYSGEVGEYEETTHGTSYFYRTSDTYKAGEVYGMTHREFHSIEFSRGARVLFFEGPQLTDTSFALSPTVQGQPVEMFSQTKTEEPEKKERG